MSKKITERINRATIANKFLNVISKCGREFFVHKGQVSLFEVDDLGYIWFIDSCSKKRIYTHYPYAWKGFTEGGTLEALVRQLRDYIMTGEIKKLNIGPWPEYICGGDLWGYGSDMQQVRDAAEQLDITSKLGTENGFNQ